MKKFISLFSAVLLLLMLCSCSSDPTLVGTSPRGSNNVGQSSTDKNVSFKLGDSVELDGVVVSFLNVTESTGTQFLTPADGKIFLLCEFEIVNNSNDDLSVSSMMSFDAYCDDYTCDYSIGALAARGNSEQLDGTVAAGKRMKGVVGYEVPIDWKELEIHYTPDITSGDEIVFISTNN